MKVYIVTCSNDYNWCLGESPIAVYKTKEAAIKGLIKFKREYGKDYSFDIQEFEVMEE